MSSEVQHEGVLPSIGLIIPSVGRPETLERALDAAKRNAPDLREVIVVAQIADTATHAVAIERGARLVTVDRRGLAWAMREGAKSSSSDIVAFTDDDAELRAGWSTRLASLYDADSIGGVGGRDAQPDGAPMTVKQAQVGTVTWFGRVVGGHHVAVGTPRFVDHIKGVNSSFRRDVFLAIDVQDEIYGEGAQARNEFVVSLLVRALGYKIILDPDLVVDHYPAERAAGDQRSGDTAKAYESAYNESLGLGLARDRRRQANALFASIIGYPQTPGVMRMRRGNTKTVAATLRGIRDGSRAARRSLVLAHAVAALRESRPASSGAKK